MNPVVKLLPLALSAVSSIKQMWKKRGGENILNYLPASELASDLSFFVLFFFYFAAPGEKKKKHPAEYLNTT